MKIYCETNNPSVTLKRVVSQVKATAPKTVQFVKDMDQCDLAIVLVIGRTDPGPFLERKIPTVILQLCFLTAGGSAPDWQDVWDQCVMVGSYYDLPIRDLDRFVRFPLGYDPSVFYRSHQRYKLFGAVVTGRVDGPEEISSVVRAFTQVAHVGQPLPDMGPGYHSFDMISDDELRRLYQSSLYVIGLRRIEGFELPIIEGGACGAIPITFDLDCYRHWFQGRALFIPPDFETEKHLKRIADGVIPHRLQNIDWGDFEQVRVWRPFWTKLTSLSEVK